MDSKLIRIRNSMSNIKKKNHFYLACVYVAFKKSCKSLWKNKHAILQGYRDTCKEKTDKESNNIK